MKFECDWFQTLKGTLFPVIDYVRKLEVFALKDTDQFRRRPMKMLAEMNFCAIVPEATVTCGLSRFSSNCFYRFLSQIRQKVIRLHLLIYTEIERGLGKMRLRWKKEYLVALNSHLVLGYDSVLYIARA